MGVKKPGPKTVKNLFGFLDETGLLASPAVESLLGLGLLKVKNAPELHRSVVKLRDRTTYYDELKFSGITAVNLPIYKQLIDIYFDSAGCCFSALVFDKSKLDLNKFHNGNHSKTYSTFVAKLIADTLETSENIVVIADDVSTPDTDHYTQEIKKKVKLKARRNALFGIIRAESHALNYLQLVDVLLGSVAYAFKLERGLVPNNKNSPKRKLVKYIQCYLAIDKLAQTFDRKMNQDRQFKVKEFIGQKKDSAVE